MRKFIAYYRVSTKKQGLGIDAQKTICSNFAMVEGSEILGEFQEKESGKEYLQHRPELQKALDLCKQLGATLLVAKVDRLTRDLSDGASLCKQYSIEFCDHPGMDTLQQGIFFGMAQKEREMISQRTKQALAEKKAQGCKLGRPMAAWTTDQRAKSAESRYNAIITNPANKRAWLVIQKMKGLPNSEIANTLNECGFQTSSGKKFFGETVRRLREYFERVPGKAL